MGLCISGQKQYQNQTKKQPQTKPKAQIQNVDIVKVKLKHARDRIKNFISLKNKDINQLNEQIQQKIPQYQETKNKKKLIPLLQARKQIQKQIQNAQIRLKLINSKIDQVQLSKMTAQTVSVLDQSNKYINQIQQQLEKKDWRSVLQQAQNRQQIQWPNDAEQIQQDPIFLQMWKQIGGQKIVEKKKATVNVNINQNTQKQKTNQKKQVVYA